MTGPKNVKATLTEDELKHAESVAEASRQVARRVQFPGDSSMDVKEWLSIRKAAALKIDPQTAEVTWCYAQTLDPYGVRPDLPEEAQQVGREYFARSPNSDVWVEFGDLPERTRRALLERF